MAHSGLFVGPREPLFRDPGRPRPNQNPGTLLSFSDTSTTLENMFMTSVQQPRDICRPGLLSNISRFVRAGCLIALLAFAVHPAFGADDLLTVEASPSGFTGTFFTY